MRKTILAASVVALAALSLTACNKPKDAAPAADAAAAPAADAAAAPAAPAATAPAADAAAPAAAPPASDAPPTRGDPTKQ